MGWVLVRRMSKYSKYWGPQPKMSPMKSVLRVPGGRWRLVSSDHPGGAAGGWLSIAIGAC